MSMLTITDLDDRLLDVLQERAQRHGQSPEEEARTILTAALDPEDCWAEVDEIRRRLATSGQLGTDSALLLREDRQR